MSDNLFKRKTKVINDDDEEESVDVRKHDTREENKQTENEDKRGHTLNQNYKSSSDKNGKTDKHNTPNKKIDESGIKSTSQKEGGNNTKNNINPEVKKNSGMKLLEEKINQVKNVSNVNSAYKNTNNSEVKKSSNPQKPNIPSGIKKVEKNETIHESNTSNNIQTTKKVSNTREEMLQKKRKRESSSSSGDSRPNQEESEDSSFSSSEEDGSDDGSSESSSSSEVSQKKAKQQQQITPIKKKPVPVITQERKEKKVGKVLKTKSTLVNQLLRRWWYALPKWPPEDFDARLVEKSEWKFEPEVDGKGYTKCIEFDGFRNVYVDPSGKVHDLRPKDTMPSYNNFLKKDERNLYELLIEALKRQIEELTTEEKYSSEDTDILASLREELKEAQRNYERIRINN